MSANLKFFGLSFGKLLLFAVLAIFALFVLLAFLQIGFIYAIYRMVEDWVAVRLGFDYYVSNLAATAFTSLFVLLFPMLCCYIFLGKRNRAWSLGALVGLQILICLSVYTIGAGVCFDRRSGKPLCYFVDTPKGRVWSYTPGFDPESGRKFQIYTREIKESEDLQKQFRKR